MQRRSKMSTVSSELCHLAQGMAGRREPVGTDGGHVKEGLWRVKSVVRRLRREN